MKCIMGTLIWCLLCACDREQTKNLTPTLSKSEPKASQKTGQRFLPIPEAAGSPIIYMVPRPFLALDTITGQLCRTWDYSWPNPLDAQRAIQGLPTCRSLYTSDQVEAVGDWVDVPPQQTK